MVQTATAGTHELMIAEAETTTKTAAAAAAKAEEELQSDCATIPAEAEVQERAKTGNVAL